MSYQALGASRPGASLPALADQPSAPATTGTNPRRRARLAALASAGIALALAASACSSGSSTSPSTSSTTTSSAATAAAAAELATYTGIPAFTAPGAGIDISSLKGKTIYSIPQSAAIPFLSATEQAEKNLATQLGITFVEYPTQGTPAEWIRGINQAIAAKASAILLNALDPRLVAPQVAAAKAAGIPVVSAQFFDISQASQVPATLAASRGDNFTEAAKLEADYVIKDTGGKADVLVVENTEQLSTVAMLTAMKAEFAANCSGCTVKYVNVPSADWATRIQTEVQSAIVADPNLNYVIPIYDPMTQFVLPAITAAGKTGKIHIATFNGTPDALKMLETGDTVRMDIGENLEWLASANLDELFRAMLGKPTLTDEKTALRVFTKSTVGETGNPPAYNLGFGSAYKAGYEKLWGVTGA
jgi:ribose transport system substrate-binding protein